VPTVSAVSVWAGYRGKSVVKGVNFSTGSRGVYAVIGPNGSGKTTLLRVVAGVLEPYRGDVLIDDRSVFRDSEVKKVIGYMPADIGLLPRLTLFENLLLFLQLLGYGRDFLKRRLEELGKLIELEDILYAKCGSLSTGQRVRAGIARALIHDPEVVILDEPTRGLDAVHAKRVRALLRELSRSKLIVFTTHLIHEVLELSDWVAVMKGGKIVFSGSVSEFSAALSTKPVTVFVKTAYPIDDLLRDRGLEFEKKGFATYLVKLPRLSELPELLTRIALTAPILEVREDLDEVISALYGGA